MSTLNISKASRPPFKIELTLRILLIAGDSGVNQPEAHIEYGETCLHTSASTIQNKYGIQIMRKSEPWKHRHGGKTYFTRYSIPDWQRNKALQLLNLKRKRRGLLPIKHVVELISMELAA